MTALSVTATIEAALEALDPVWGETTGAVARRGAPLILNEDGTPRKSLNKKAKATATTGRSSGARFPRPNGEDYWARHIKKGSTVTDIDALRMNRGADVPTVMWGDPGTGKSALIEAAFADQPGGLYTVPGHGHMEEPALLGSWQQKPDGTYEFVKGPAILAAENGGVLFIDEIALIPPATLAVLYPLMDGRRETTIDANLALGTIKAQPGFFVVGAYNPGAPGARVSEALTSRFIFSVEVTTDYDLAKSLGVPAKFVTLARNIHTKKVSGELDWAPQLRELLGAKKVTDLYGDEQMAVANLVSGAPEDDRELVAAMASRVFGSTVENLRLGDQAK